MQVTPQQVQQEIANQGGSPMQQLVGAALVDGIESNGDPTELSGGIGPAAGLFQFEPGTWQSNGGGQFAPVAQDATWQQQVTVFLNATKGDNFGAWGPDLGANYGYSGAPKPGSPVATKIAELMQAGTTATASTGSAAGGAAQATTTGLLSGVGDIEAFFGKVTSVDFWIRIGTGVLGAALFVTGLYILFDSTDTGKKITSEGQKVAEVAAIA